MSLQAGVLGDVSISVEILSFCQCMHPNALGTGH